MLHGADTLVFVLYNTVHLNNNLIIMELSQFFVRTNLQNRAKGSQQTQSEC